MKQHQGTILGPHKFLLFDLKTSLTNIRPFISPGWCFNAHLHTIGCSIFKQPDKPSCQRIKILTPDNDFLELDVIDAQNQNPVIALFHGLEGSTDRYYIIELMQSFNRIGFSVVAVNFRSCGSQMNRTRRFYHSGATEDLNTVFEWIKKHFPDSNMGAVGFSLGGNVLLKSLGEIGKNHPLKAAVAVSVPYNLKTGAVAINQGFNKIYERRFLKSLTNKLQIKKKIFTDLPEFRGTTLYDFDDQVTGPIHGFAGAEDYYSRCSSDQFLSEINCPTLLIHSSKDPICPIQKLPLSAVQNNDNLDYIITEEGGHVGFWSRPAGWLNGCILSFVRKKL